MPSRSTLSTITVLDPPDRGAHSDRAPYRLPLDAIDANNTQNVTFRDGLLVNRPGFTQLTVIPVPAGNPMGGLLYQTGLTFATIVGTTAGWYKLNTTGSPYFWTDLTGGVPLNGTDDDHNRFVTFPFTNQYWLIGVNGYNDAPKYTPNGVTNYAPLGGSPPPAKDIAIAADRVLLFNTFETAEPQLYRVRWSGFNTPNTWAAPDFADLSDTEDVIVAGRALSRVTVAIHKEQSQWVGFANPGLFPFRFEMQDQKPGPVSCAALIAVEGRHYYLANDGSIYVFDGQRTTHIGEPIRRWISNNLNFALKQRSFAFYSRRDRDIFFCFPSGVATACDLAVSLNIDTGRFFPHRFGQALTSGFRWVIQATLAWSNGGSNDLSPFTWLGGGNPIANTYPTWLSMGGGSTPVEIVTQHSGVVHVFGLAPTDNGTNPTAKWRHGPVALGERGVRARVTSLETHFKQTAAAMTVTAAVGTSDTLAGDPVYPAELSNSFSTAGADSLNAFDFVTATPGVGTGTAEARFASVQHSLTTTTDWAWEGAVLRSEPLEPA